MKVPDWTLKPNVTYAAQWQICKTKNCYPLLRLQLSNSWQLTQPITVIKILRHRLNIFLINPSNHLKAKVRPLGKNQISFSCPSILNGFLIHNIFITVYNLNFHKSIIYI